MRRLIVLTALLATLGLAGPTRAAFIITIGGATIPQGGTGTVDVLIRSDNPSGDLLRSFGFDLRISPSGSQALRFQDPQSDAELSAPNYVFAGPGSADLADGVPMGDVASILGGINNQYVGGDDTANLSNVTVTTDRLLVRLDLSAVAATQGQSFTISLQNNAFTFFQNASGGSPGFSSTAGTILIGPAIPEPASLALLGLGGLVALLAPRRLWRAAPR